MEWKVGLHDACVGVCIAIGQNDPRFVVAQFDQTRSIVLRVRVNIGGQERELVANLAPHNKADDAKIGVCRQAAINQAQQKRDGRPSDFEDVDV